MGLNLVYSMVLGIQWLKAVEPHIDWSSCAVAFLHSGCWTSLQSQLSDTLPASNELYLLTIKSAAQLARTLKQSDQCDCFMLNFTHCAAHGGDKFAKVN